MDLDYNQRNRHLRDSEIKFDAESHTYTHKGEQYKSVTTVVESCFQQFDCDYWAARKAPEMGMTAEQVKALWERKGEEARNLGSMMHEKIERYYLGLPNDTDPTYDMFQAFTKKYQLHPYRTEWAIYDEEYKVAGTLDFLNCENGVYSIYDWKRSNKILVNGTPEVESRWNKRAFEPIAHVHDTTFWHYALQLSIYRFILERNYGIIVDINRLGVFHPDNPCPYVVTVPYMRDEVIAVLTARLRQK